MSKNNITRKIILLIFFGVFFTYHFQNAIAQDSTLTSTENLFKSASIDLPPATLTCRTGGILTELFSKTGKFTSGGNALFTDKINREIGLFEHASVVNDSNGGDEKLTADIFIKIPDVKRENLVTLLLQKKIVVTTNPQIVFLIRKTTSSGEETYINASDEVGAPSNSTIFTLIRKLGNIQYKGQKFITASGIVKIYFSKPPKKADASGNLVDVFDDLPGSIICNFQGAPIHDFDLIDLKDAFDGQLADAVISEASMTGNGN